jgi:hypothetical protein
MNTCRQSAAPGGGPLLPAWNPEGSDSPAARDLRQGLRCANNFRFWTIRLLSVHKKMAWAYFWLKCLKMGIILKLKPSDI